MKPLKIHFIGVGAHENFLVGGNCEWLIDENFPTLTLIHSPKHHAVVLVGDVALGVQGLDSASGRDQIGEGPAEVQYLLPNHVYFLPDHEGEQLCPERLVDVNARTEGRKNQVAWVIFFYAVLYYALASSEVHGSFHQQLSVGHRGAWAQDAGHGLRRGDSSMAQDEVACLADSTGNLVLEVLDREKAQTLEGLQQIP